MTTTLEKTANAEKPMEFIPFGAADKIKLTVGIIQATVCIPTRSGKVCTPRDAMRFMMLCQAQRLNPFAGDCFLCGYDGKNGPVFSLITAHQAFLKRAETCADYEGMESGIIICDDNGVCSEREGDFVLDAENCVGGWARVHRKGRKPTYRRLSIAAMMPNYETPFWGKTKAPGQIVKCAEADALRATFPTLLGGLYTGEQLNMSATVSSLGAIDLPQVIQQQILPEAAREITDEKETPPAGAPREKLTPQMELEGIVIGGGFTFPTFVAWVKESQDMDDADSWTQFSEVPADFAKRMLKAQRGLLDSLAKMKAGGRMSKDEIIAELGPTLDAILQLDLASYVNELRIVLSKRNSQFYLAYDSWCYMKRFEAESVPELFEKIKNFDPKAHERDRIKGEIAKLNSELTTLEAALVQERATP